MHPRPAAFGWLALSFALAWPLPAAASPLPTVSQLRPRAAATPASPVPRSRESRLARSGGPGWSHLDFGFRVSRTRSAGLTDFGLSLHVGSDEGGYWYSQQPLAQGFDWTPRGDELGGGVTHIMDRFVISPSQATITCVVRERGTLKPQVLYSEDAGLTFAASTFDTPFEADRVKRMLPDGNFSNVAYLIAYGFDSDRSESGWLLARSTSGGRDWEEVQFDASALDMDLWSSHDIPSHVVFATDDGSDVRIDASSDQLGSWSQQHSFVGYGGGLGIDVTLCDAELSKVWLRAGSDLIVWDGVSESAVSSMSDPIPGTLTAGITTIDYLMWADGQSVFVSTDGGLTSSMLPNADWFFNEDHVNNVPLAIQCLRPLVFPSTAPHAAARPRSPEDVRGLVPLERFYISTGSGTYVHVAGDPFARLLTDPTMQNLQVHDIVPVATSSEHSFELATRDLGQLTVRDDFLPFGWVGAVGTYPNDCGVVATNGLPGGGDPHRVSQFRGALAIVQGQGEFASASLPNGFIPSAYKTLVAHPTVPLRWFWCDEDMHQIDYNTLTNAITLTTVGPPPSYGEKLGYAVAPSNPATRYASTMGFGFGAAIARSTDGGASWNAVSFAGPYGANDGTFDDIRVTILVSPTDPNRAFAAGSTVMGTTDGVNWVNLYGGLPPVTIFYDLAFDASDLSIIWAATSQGVFRLEAGVWTDMTPTFGPVPNVPFRAIAADPSNDRMLAASYGRGIYAYDLGSSVSAPAAGAPALSLAPRQNPMREAGFIEFTLPVGGDVTLELLDVAGRRVVVIAEGAFAAGRHSAVVPARSLDAGIYLARLSAAGASRTAKLVVTR